MVYVGSKRKLAPIITKVITQNLPKGGTYLEPFCGGCAIAEALPQQTYNMVLSDINPYLIALFQLSQQGWIPPSAPESKDKWLYHAKTHPDENKGLTGYFKFLYGFRGSSLGYCVPDGDTSYYTAKRTSYLNTINTLKQATFLHRSYKDITLQELDPNTILIYCDPPYQDTRQDAYNGLTNFNHNLFWEWVRQNSKQGYKILTSECQAPDDFISIKAIPYKHILAGAYNKERTEHLFIHKDSKHLWKTEQRIKLF